MQRDRKFCLVAYRKIQLNKMHLPVKAAFAFTGKSNQLLFKPSYYSFGKYFGGKEPTAATVQDMPELGLQVPV